LTIDRNSPGARALPPVPAIQPAVIAVALAAAVGLASAIAEFGMRQVAVFALGMLLGITLFHAAFGFAASYRSLFVARDARGVRAQIVMLAVATILFAPVLSMGEVFGREVYGAVAPLGVQVAVGSFLFGVGMQLAGGCGSGTLFALGGGSPRMAVTLFAFCIGSFWASLDFAYWQALPSWGELVLGDALGWPGALLAQLAALAAMWLALRRWSGSPPPSPVERNLRWRRWLRGPWPMLAGAVALAGLNFVTLVVAGHPWSITWAFALWAAKTAQVIGWNADQTSFWSDGFPRAALEAPLLADVVTVMDFGLVLGALAAAGLAGRFAPNIRVPRRSWLAALIGGLAMGYGARIAFGCNVGAFFSGAASTSLHGWLWIVSALVGTWFGVRLRPVFGLRN
jgi:uncharacterized membrane protein YedE/YeeE